MSKKEGKNPTKSIYWQSIDKKTQKNLIELYGDWKQASENNQNTKEHKFKTALWYALGSKTKIFNTETITRLEAIIEKPKRGGVFDEITEFVNRYRTVESAIENLATKNQSKSEKNR